MADNVAITPGVGASVATKDVGGVQYQVVETLPHRGKAATMSSVQINVSTSGDTDLVALVAAQFIRVMGFFMEAIGGSVDVILKDGTAAVNMSPAIRLVDKGSWFLPKDGEPWFITAAGSKLTINLSAAIQVSGRIYYSQSLL